MMGLLLLDTFVDNNVNFMALSGLRAPFSNGENEHAQADMNQSTSESLPLVPAAGSKHWLPSIVDVGRHKALLRRRMSNESSTDDADSSGDASDAFFVVDLECVLHKYRRWHQCFPRVKPFYAVKCNPNREVVRVLATTSGCGFDCASPAEIGQVLQCGVDPSRIIYANPCKDVAALEYALDAGVGTMTFDSEDELRKIRRHLDIRAKLAPSNKVTVQVVLRLRVPDAHSDCPLGEKYGAVEKVCDELIALTIQLHLPLIGVSFHCGSGCQDAQAYPAAIEVARAVFDLAARHGVKLTLLDIGGGFPGWDGSEYVYQQNRDVADYAVNPVGASPWKEALDVDDMQRRRGPEEGDGGIPDDHVAAIPPLSLEKIAEATLPVLDKLFPPSSGVQVIAEPGRYFVEASHVLFARIYAKRRLSLQATIAGDPSNIGGSRGEVGQHQQRRTSVYYIEEGVHGCFKDRVLCGVNFEPCPIERPSRTETTALWTANGRNRDTAESTSHVSASHQLRENTVQDYEEEEDAVIMGPSGLPSDVVARKPLPKSLQAGDWLYFSRMGAYTASIATLASSAVSETSYCYVASARAENKGEAS